MASRPHVTAVLVAAIALGACQPGTSPIRALMPLASAPDVADPADLGSIQTADQAAQRMLAEIAANERTLGRALAPARILRVRRLAAGEMYWWNRLDGTNPDQSGFSPDGGPGWAVEAMGTFLGRDAATGVLESRGMHGFHLWDDAGGQALGFIPCWTRVPAPREVLEGSC